MNIRDVCAEYDTATDDLKETIKLLQQGERNARAEDYNDAVSRFSNQVDALLRDVDKVLTQLRETREKIVDFAQQLILEKSLAQDANRKRERKEMENRENGNSVNGIDLGADPECLFCTAERDIRR